MNEGKFQLENPKILSFHVKARIRFATFKEKRCDLYLSFLPFVAACKNIYLLYTESDG
jgi:hypothetical protein